MTGVPMNLSTPEPELEYAKLQLELTEMNDMVTAVAVSPDSLNVAAVSDTGEVRVWGILDQSNYVFKKPKTTETGEEDEETDVWPGNIAFSQNGQFLAVAFETIVYLWIARTGQLKFKFLHQRGITSVAFSPDSKHLACGAQDILIWNVEIKQQVYVLKGHTSHVSWLSYFSGSAKLVSASYDSTIRQWDLEQEDKLGSTWEIEEDVRFNCSSLSPDGQLLVSGDTGGQVIVWDIESGDWLERPYTGQSDEENGVSSVSFSPDGKHVASASDEGVHILDSKSGSCIAEIACSDYLAVYTPDGKYLVTRDKECPSLVRVLELATPAVPFPVHPTPGRSGRTQSATARGACASSAFAPPEQDDGMPTTVKSEQ